MKIKSFAVIDTNVVVSSVISKTGFPKIIIEYVEKGNIIPIYDKRILYEYYKVLHYDKFKASNKKAPSFKENDIYDVLYNVVSNGIMVNDVEVAKGEFVDKDDIPFFEVKMSTEEFEPYLITGNIKHFPESPFIVTPKEMINIMEQLDRFLSRDINYEEAITNLIGNELSTNKYTSGMELLDKIFDSENKRIKGTFFR